MIGRRLTRHFSDVVISSLVTIVAFGAIEPFPAILLAVKLNVFAIPLGILGVLEFPIWAWYCISILWMSQAIYLLKTDIRGVVQTVKLGIVSVSDRYRAAPITEVDHAESQGE